MSRFGSKMIFSFVFVCMVTTSTSQTMNDLIASNLGNIRQQQGEIMKSLKDFTRSNFPSQDKLVDVAPGKQIYVSSLFLDEKVEHATDGLEGTLFHSEHDETPWWMIDLEDERSIFNVLILTRRDACCADRYHDVEIRLGNTFEGNGNFSSHKLLQFYKGPYTPDQGYLIYTFPNGVQGRYLSIKIVKGGPEYLQLHEVKIIAQRI